MFCRVILPGMRRQMKLSLKIQMGLVWRFTKKEGAIKIIVKTVQYVLPKLL